MIANTILITGILLILLFVAGSYVAAAIGIVGLTLLTVFTDRPLWDITGIMAWNVNTTEVLLAIPFFVLMGEFLTAGGITERVYRSLSQWLNPIPGGMLHTNVAASAVFAAMSGSSAATTATIGTVALPFFRARQYDERMILGSVAAGGTLGILIPPSVPMIVYAVLAQESVGRLYMAGIIPGLLLTFLFMTVIYIVAILRPGVAPKEAPVNIQQRWIALVSLTPVGMLVFLCLGSIYLGIATPTESAALGCVAAFGLAISTGNLTRDAIIGCFLSMCSIAGMIMLVTTAAFILQFALGALGVSSALARAAASSGLTATEMLFVVILIYLLLGCFMDSFSIIVTTIPILVPVLKALSVDLVWFGIIVVMLNEAGLITPPYGLNLFVIQGIRQRTSIRNGSAPIIDVYIGILPFLVAMGLGLGLIFAFPDIALWLPNKMLGR
jgi:C4-dicarboxylate transporter DctM subunit